MMESSEKSHKSNDASLPKKPERPLDSDCCGQGCLPCVFDLYEEEMEIWKEECRKIADGGNSECQTEESGPVLSVDEYRKFTVESVTIETRDSYRYRFTLPFGQSLGVKTGQHIVIRGSVNGEPVLRQYTPVSDVGAKSYFILIIKIYEHGKFSQFVKTWSVGSEVLIRGPCGSLDYKPNKWKKVYMLAVGTGLAPMSQEEPSSGHKYGYGEEIICGRITLSVLQETLSDLRDNIFILICGTRSFESDMLDGMKLMGIAPENYHKF